jgi:lysophospholipase L1-like esterase
MAIFRGPLTAAERSMMRRLVANVLLSTALALAVACSSGDGAQNGGTSGGASGGTTAIGGGSGDATGGDASDGQTMGAVGGIGGMPGQAGAHSGAGGAATGGYPSAGMGGSVFTGTGGSGGSTGGSDAAGGGTGGFGATGGGGTVAYAPCPTNGSPCTILPLGDSITRGFRSSDDGGYRSQLFKLIVAAKQKITFTGSLTNGPTQVSGQPFPRMHEGHSGWTISQLSPLIPSPALDGKPNIILLHIGTNDIGSRDPAGMATHLEALLDKIAQNGPNALIVVAQITAAFTDNDIRDAYNAKIPGIVQSHAAKGQHIIGVDMNKIPMTDLSSDGVHPNDQGYVYMAGIWYAALKDLLPQ